MDNISKMRILYIFCLALISIMHAAKIAEPRNRPALALNIYSRILDTSRKKREVDEEDVVNKFEMERVSPLYDIVHHLPPFDDGWISDPVTSSIFLPSPSIHLKNESSSYDEYKIEVVQDEEHVISESGRQFKENAALNWYYSAESFSSVNNFTNASPQVTTMKTTTISELVEKPTTQNVQSPTSRKQDEEHVVSHVPSLKGGRGAFLDFNLLEASTTPQVDSILPPKTEAPKPNITTRYILLQSGRIVAINVTSVATSVLNPKSSSGSGKRNPLLPTIYFGSRIKNKNTTKTTVDDTKSKSQEKFKAKPMKLDVTTQDNTRRFIDFTKAVTSKTTIPTFRPQSKNKVEVSTTKSSVNINKPLTIKPDVQYFRTPPKSSTTSARPFTITPNVQYSKTKSNSAENKSQQLNTFPLTTKSQSLRGLSTTKFPAHLNNNNTTLDPVQRWWNEMKSAREDRIALLTTTERPKTSTRNALRTLIDAIQTSTQGDKFSTSTFDSIKTPLETTVTEPTIELKSNARSAKLRMTERNALHFSTTASSTTSPKASFATKPSRFWTTFAPVTVKVKKINENPVVSVKEDLLELSVPLSEVNHDFVRIVTLPPPVTSAPALNKVTIPTAAPVKMSSRRPRYRGLSHVNLQAPKHQAIKPTTSVPHQNALTTQSYFQLSTTSYTRPTGHGWWNFGSTTSERPPPQKLSTTPATRSRPGFFLRNSVSFQTIPPGSLTDRRTLTNEAQDTGAAVVENLQPPLEDLLIISFEPTRKSNDPRDTETFTEKSIKIQEKRRDFRVPIKQTHVAPAVPKQTAKTFSTPAPFKRFTEKTSSVTGQSKSDSGNRVGRHFRTNNSRFQSITEKSASTTSSTSTTKQPFRVYFFEPKRRQKNSDGDRKNESAKPTSAGKSQRTQIQASLQNAHGGRVRNAPVSQTPNARSGRQLQLTARAQSPQTNDPTTTPKPAAVRKLKSSPFIWHRPNVGTSRPVSR